MLRKLIYGLALIGFAVTAAQAQTSATEADSDTQVVKTGMESYLTVMPYYLMADEDRGPEVDAGTGFMFGYGRQIDGGFFWEGQAFAGLIDSGIDGASDFYQYGLGLDIMYRFARDAAISPFVLAGLGGIYNDVVPDDDDGTSLFGNIGLGAMTGPITDGGLRLRAEARYIYDRFETADNEGMSDVRIALGLVAPLGQHVVERTVVKTVTDEAPLIDSDGDGVPDNSDDCPNTLPGSLVDSRGCAQDNQTVELEGVKFEYDKATLTANAEVILRNAVKALKGQPSMRVEIAGHTDSIASQSYNLDLSQRRADSVKRFLAEHGIDPSRMTTVGYGETRPIATNETPEGRQKNRRVELHILDN